MDQRIEDATLSVLVYRLLFRYGRLNPPTAMILSSITFCREWRESPGVFLYWRFATLGREFPLSQDFDIASDVSRGTFAGVAPSDISRPGVFAREFEPAKGEMYATYAERVRVNGIGWKRGCHTCGSRLPGKKMHSALPLSRSR
jgi:hypothetical protein